MEEKPARNFEQHHLKVQKTARYAVMGSFGAALAEVWVVCHGHGQLATRFLSHFAPLDREDRLIVAPEALSRYYLASPTPVHGRGSPVGATWMTSEDREAEIADYVAYLDLLHEEIFTRVKRERVKLHVLGFSQGAATVSRWVAAGKAKADRVIIWGGLLPPELQAGEMRALAARAPLAMVVGRSDEYATRDVVAAQEARLTAAGVAYETIWFDGGHDIVESGLRQLASAESR